MDLQDIQRWLLAGGIVLYYTFLPVFYILLWLFYLLRFIASPFIYIGYLIKEICMLPMRFIAQFEALWYFLGVAVLVGGFLGLILHLCMRAFTVVLKLDQKPAAPVAEDVPPRGHDLQSYRAARQKKKQEELAKQQEMATRARLTAAEPLLQGMKREARGFISIPAPASSTSNPLSPGTQRPALLRETILEHTDEEDDSAF